MQAAAQAEVDACVQLLQAAACSYGSSPARPAFAGAKQGDSSPAFAQPSSRFPDFNVEAFVGSIPSNARWAAAWGNQTGDCGCGVPERNDELSSRSCLLTPPHPLPSRIHVPPLLPAPWPTQHERRLPQRLGARHHGRCGCGQGCHPRVVSLNNNYGLFDKPANEGHSLAPIVRERLRGSPDDRHAPPADHRGGSAGERSCRWSLGCLGAQFTGCRAGAWLRQIVLATFHSGLLAPFPRSPHPSQALGLQPCPSTAALLEALTKLNQHLLKGYETELAGGNGSTLLQLIAAVQASQAGAVQVQQVQQGQLVAQLDEQQQLVAAGYGEAQLRHLTVQYDRLKAVAINQEQRLQVLESSVGQVPHRAAAAAAQTFQQLREEYDQVSARHMSCRWHWPGPAL